MTELLLKIDKTLNKRLIYKILYLLIIYYVGFNANEITIYILDNTNESIIYMICTLSILLMLKGFKSYYNNDEKYMNWFITSFVIVLITSIINLLIYFI